MQAWASFSVVIMQRGQLLRDVSSEEGDPISDGKGYRREGMGACRHPVSADLFRSWVVREREGGNGEPSK